MLNGILDAFEPSSNISPNICTECPLELIFCHLTAFSKIISTYCFLNQQFLSKVALRVFLINSSDVAAQANDDQLFAGSVGGDLGCHLTTSL